MAIRDVVTMGYGNGTFSPGVSKIPTLGYSIGEEAVIEIEGVIGFRVANDRPNYRVGDSRPHYRVSVKD